MEYLINKIYMQRYMNMTKFKFLQRVWRFASCGSFGTHYWTFHVVEEVKKLIDTCTAIGRCSGSIEEVQFTKHLLYTQWNLVSYFHKGRVWMQFRKVNNLQFRGTWGGERDVVKASDKACTNPIRLACKGSCCLAGPELDNKVNLES